ncbi:MAG: beta-galactosidase, partial [Clostridia bacterium]
AETPESPLVTALKHYKGHSALLGYDMWNETNFPSDVCYCEHTKAKFREWLRQKYGNLTELGKAWCRYSFTAWEQVMPPKTLDFFMESLDWLLFRKQNVYDQLQWRIDQIREVDQDCLITAHGTAASIDRQALNCYDEWEAADRVELYGLTYVPCRHTGAPWQFWGAVDLTRAGARGKTIWHAEMQGGPLWLQPQVLGRPKEDARIPDAKDVRLYNLTSMACGTRGVLYPRMRPILNGPLFGAFGPYGMDGHRTSRSDMASSLAVWANQPAQKPLWEASPLRGQIGILMLTQAQMGSYLLSLHGGQHAYSASVWGAYAAFFDNNIQADFVNLKDIKQYDALYLPYSLLITQEQADALKSWVVMGGTLISEGCPGYFDGFAVAQTVQPGLGLDELFGAQETEVEFTPDLLDGLELECLGQRVHGGVGLQAYRTTTGEACGCFDDGRIAAVKNDYGKGHTLLIGTYPGYAYHRDPTVYNKNFFARLFSFAGKMPYITSGNSQVKARIHSDERGRSYLWILNVSNMAQQADLVVGNGKIKGIEQVFWKAGEVTYRGENRIWVSIPEKDAIIVLLQTDKML